MRVAFFVASFPEISETFIARQVAGLLDRGHEVGIFAHHAPQCPPPAPDRSAHDLQGLVRLLPRHGLPWRRPAAAPLASARATAAAVRALGRDDVRAVGGWRSLARLLARLAPEPPFDVVHCHYGNVALHYRPVARLWDAPLVASFYGYDCSSYPRERGERVYAPLFRETAAVVSLSAHMDARLQELGCAGALLHRVPLAVDPTAFRAPDGRPPRRPGDPVRLLTVARLTEKKGIAYALEALACVAGEFPGLRYDVVGDGPLRGALERRAAALALGDRVRFLGPRSSAEVRVAMAGADLFVLPSVTAEDGDQEGTPTVLLEAACCELPVLSTWHADIPELVRDGVSGYLVPERDPAALAERLRALLGAPERWAAMGRAGRQHVAHAHATPVVAERLESLYESVRQTAPRGRRHR